MEVVEPSIYRKDLRNQIEANNQYIIIHYEYHAKRGKFVTRKALFTGI